MTATTEMTDTELGLRRAICSHPGDDTPRLVYADWLEENGRPEQAEFIRVQVGLATFGVQTPENTHLFSRLWHRERELWRTLNTVFDIGPPLPRSMRTEPRLESRLPDDPRVKQETDIVVVCRGFVDELRCDWRTWAGGPCDCAPYPNGAAIIMGVTRRRSECSRCKGSGRTPGLWETLCWRPEWTVECPEIKWRVLAAGTVDVETRSRRTRRDGKTGPCPKWCKGGCSGKGRVLRPFPPAAQPVRRVVLTTVPGPERVAGDGSGQRYRLPGFTAVYQPSSAEWQADIVKALLAAEWPGVEFAMTPA